MELQGICGEFVKDVWWNCYSSVMNMERICGGFFMDLWGIRETGMDICCMYEIELS